MYVQKPKDTYKHEHFIKHLVYILTVTPREVVQARVEFRSVFLASFQNFKILAIPDVLAHESSFDRFLCTISEIKKQAILDVLAHGKSYEHGFMKKRDGHKLCVKSCAVKFRLVFRAPSRKFKILVIPVLLAHGKLYEHDIAKKCDGHKFCVKSRAESSFDRFFCAPSRKFKILPIPDVLAHGMSYEHGFMKKSTVIKFARSRAQSRVSIDFSCTVSKI
ncbi:hypothetical protein BHM03_00062148 [Ensete ventricosum]|nr:hypothetical protein BHM03_00062148 [Ensete ventricosum]